MDPTKTEHINFLNEAYKNVNTYELADKLKHFQWQLEKLYDTPIKNISPDLKKSLLNTI
jgi:hypothetical protein